MNFEEHYEKYRLQIQSWLETYQRSWDTPVGLNSTTVEPYLRLHEAMAYSLLCGGKRFRPVLGLLLAEALDCPAERALPYLAAVEMVHTYSLIHDDLPCMDNDDLRRGEPTNHKVFGESCALLAGDGLLTEAFLLIAEFYKAEPALGLELGVVLSKAAGFRGMVGGQAVDLFAKDRGFDLSSLKTMQAMKTGALIRSAVEGVSRIANSSAERHQKITAFGENVGFAFQLKDDLLDSSKDQLEKGSFPELLGWDETETMLVELSEKTSKLLDEIGVKGQHLRQILEMNLIRSK